MKQRPFWIERLRTGWASRPVVWLAGVRRVGKTTLARMLDDAIYVNCDLPSSARRLEDPEVFYRGLPDGATVVLDEVHRLADPSLVLKIAADAFPGLRVLATGSSTLAATKKFRDSLTGRKAVVHLPPVLWTECEADFGIRDIDRRLFHGGLPEPLLADRKDPEFFSEWLDSFYARDIQELFGIRERTGFLNLLRLMLRQSGGLLDYSALSRECDLTRPTIKAHMEAMAVACVLTLVRPFHGGGRREFVRRPRAYGFDTGFVAFVRGWDTVREEDRGVLWDHLVLDTLRACNIGRDVHYWRDKSGREVNFVVPMGTDEVHAVECKVNPDHMDSASLRVFRQAYPGGRNYLVCPGVAESYDRRYGDLIVKVVSCRHLMADLKPAP